MTSWTFRFIFNCPPRQWPTGKKREKDRNTKIEYLEKEKSFLDELKNICHSFWSAIIWWKNKNLMKIVDTSFKITTQETYWYSYIYFDTPDVSNDSLCRKLKKIIVSERLFQIWHLFIFYWYCNYKQIRWLYTGSAFLELKVPVYKTVLKLQTNLSTLYW